jgi:hypothetical protein
MLLSAVSFEHDAAAAGPPAAAAAPPAAAAAPPAAAAAPAVIAAPAIKGFKASVSMDGIESVMVEDSDEEIFTIAHANATEDVLEKLIRLRQLQTLKTLSPGQQASIIIQ